MRNKTILLSTLLIALFSIVLMSGCKKEEDDDNNNGTSAKIKTWTYPDISGPNNVTATYAYDNQGRINTITYTGARTGVISYTYGANTITELDDQGFTHTMNLNADGYVVSDSVTDSGMLIGLSTYTYNADGYKTAEDGSDTYTWSGGNMVSNTENGGTSYTYLSDKVNTIGNHNKGILFYGKDSKNLPATITRWGSTNAYSYEYDSQGRVAKVNGDEIYTYY